LYTTYEDWTLINIPLACTVRGGNEYNFTLVFKLGACVIVSPNNAIFLNFRSFNDTYLIFPSIIRLAKKVKMLT
jgi:hypothetical protein